MSNKIKLSPWHDGSVLPVHAGVYEGYDHYLDKNYYSYFDGNGYCGWWETIEFALENKKFNHSIDPITKWRGIVK